MRLTVLLFLLFTSAAHAQTSLRVIVSDASTGVALNAAVVTLTRPNGSVMRAETDTAGFASFTRLSAGAHTISASAIGYEASTAREIQIEAETLTDLIVSLKPAPFGIKPVEASVTRQPPVLPDLQSNGFYDRMKLNNGIFIDRAEIEDRDQRLISDLIRAKAGVNLRLARGEQMLWFRSSEMPGLTSTRPARLCGPTIFLDGLVVHHSDGETPTPIDRFVNTKDLVGIEIYRRPSQIPEQYGGAHSGCGVILLWTRVKS